ncbi:MAG: hypothetical protein EXR70_20350 [Deltaproteobacteria bacterium]|nr:hypothetical protein [Deltaproteobacteria bacterium]
MLPRAQTASFRLYVGGSVSNICQLRRAIADPNWIKSIVSRGIYDYILKPYTAHTIARLNATLERLKADLTKSTSPK